MFAEVFFFSPAWEKDPSNLTFAFITVSDKISTMSQIVLKFISDFNMTSNISYQIFHDQIIWAAIHINVSYLCTLEQWSFPE